MTTIGEAQAHDAVALDVATTAYFTLRGSTSRDGTPTSGPSYPSPMSGLKQEVADDQAAEKKASDEAAAEKQWQSQMMAMMQDLTSNLARERAARIKLQKSVRAWEKQYPEQFWEEQHPEEVSHDLYGIAEDDDPSVPGEYFPVEPQVAVPPGLPAELPYPTRAHTADDWEEPEDAQWSSEQYVRRDPWSAGDP